MTEQPHRPFGIGDVVTIPGVGDARVTRFVRDDSWRTGRRHLLELHTDDHRIFRMPAGAVHHSERQDTTA